MDKFKPFKLKVNSEKIVISIRIDESILADIDKLAAYGNISRNEFINQCIKYALDNIEIKGNVEKKKEDIKILSSVS